MEQTFGLPMAPLQSFSTAKGCRGDFQRWQEILFQEKNVPNSEFEMSIEILFRSSQNFLFQLSL